MKPSVVQRLACKLLNLLELEWRFYHSPQVAEALEPMRVVVQLLKAGKHGALPQNGDAT